MSTSFPPPPPPPSPRASRDGDGRLAVAASASVETQPSSTGAAVTTATSTPARTQSQASALLPPSPPPPEQRSADATTESKLEGPDRAPSTASPADAEEGPISPVPPAHRTPSPRAHSALLSPEAASPSSASAAEKPERGAPGDGARGGASSSFLRAALFVFAKDLAIELATREILTTAGFFAVLVAVMTSVAFATGPETTTRVAPGALWLAIAFSAILALGRSWQREREEWALVGLLVSPVPRAAIWCGKTAGVFGFMSAVEVVIVGLVSLLFHVDLPSVAVPLLPVLVLGTLGVAATGTLFGAMTVRTRARELLLASVLFPLLSPALLSSIGATREIFYAVERVQGVDFSDVRDWLLILTVFDVVAVAGGVAMFGALVED